VVINFAVEVGSLHVLKMLFVLSCADLAAVGPDVLNDWKMRLMTDLYQRASDCLAGAAASTHSRRRDAAFRREFELRVKPKDDTDAKWWSRQLDAMPIQSLHKSQFDELIGHMKQLQTLAPDQAHATGCYRPELQTVEYTIGAHESVAEGIFHRLTGALSSRGMEILSAEIHTLADGLVLDRFYVIDSDYEGEPPADRIEQVCESLRSCLQADAEKPPTFRRVWGAGADEELPIQPTRIRFDNNTSPSCTILDVFTHDYRGLLYTLTRTIFELGLSVSVAKIGTHVDQVVDVFYVTDQQGEKITDNERLAEIERQLHEAIDGLSD
jgi:[protein-PII] uridylyltransferase